MSTSTSNIPPTNETAGSKFHIFVQVALLLAAITGVEIIIIFLPFPKWLLVSALVFFSTVKFGFVIFAFMHLRWDKLFCTLLFFIGLTVAGLILWALLRLFSAEASMPLENAGNAVAQAEITPAQTAFCSSARASVVLMPNVLLGRSLAASSCEKHGCTRLHDEARCGKGRLAQAAKSQRHLFRQLVHIQGFLRLD